MTALISTRFVLVSAALSGMFSVIFGAFGAHGLKPVLATWALTTYQTAVEYQFYHTFALMMVGILMAQKKTVSLRLLTLSASFFLLGIFLFCGSLYALSLSEYISGEKVSWLGAITPIGGTLFIAGWATLAYSATQYTDRSH